MFTETGNFMLSDFSNTHNQLLFRKLNVTSEGEIEGNLDLLFEGVHFIQAPLLVENPQIRQASEEEKAMFMEQNSLQNLDGRKLVAILHDGGKNYIAANRVLFQENQLLPTQSSIPIKLEALNALSGNETYKESASNWRQIA